MTLNQVLKGIFIQWPLFMLAVAIPLIVLVFLGAGAVLLSGALLTIIGIPIVKIGVYFITFTSLVGIAYVSVSLLWIIAALTWDSIKRWGQPRKDPSIVENNWKVIYEKMYKSDLNDLL